MTGKYYDCPLFTIGKSFLKGNRVGNATIQVVLVINPLHLRDKGKRRGCRQQVSEVLGRSPIELLVFGSTGVAVGNHHLHARCRVCKGFVVEKHLLSRYVMVNKVPIEVVALTD